MTRGTIVVFCNGGIYNTTQYNGDMYPEGIGGEAYELLQNVKDIDDFEYLARNINLHYGYEEGNNIFLSAKKGTKRYAELRELNTERYFRDWNSDYLYVKNLETEPVCMKCRRKEGDSLYINPGSIAVFCFGEYVDNIEERLSKQDKMSSKKKTLFVYLEHNDSEPLAKAIVRSFSEKSDAEAYLRERVRKAYGQYPEELEQDSLYEDDTIQPDTVVIQNDGGDVSSFVIMETEED